MRDWFFEVWNEPNWPAFWTGKKSGYFKLYQYAAEAVKEVDADFPVGGPATAQNKWIPQFLQHCRRQKLPVDFVSTHHYPNDPPLDKMGDTTSGQLAHARRSILREQACDARREAALCRFFIQNGIYRQMAVIRCMINRMLRHSLSRLLSKRMAWWIYTVSGCLPIFLPRRGLTSRPFHGGFGLMNLHGIPKPAYRAFELLHGLGEELLISDGLHPTLDAWFVRGSKKITGTADEHCVAGT